MDVPPLAFLFNIVNGHISLNQSRSKTSRYTFYKGMMFNKTLDTLTCYLKLWLQKAANCREGY